MAILIYGYIVFET